MKFDKFNLFIFVAIVLLIFGLAAMARGQQTDAGETTEQPLSGGTFTITKSVVAGGGQTTLENAPLNVSATAGQTVAGNTSTGGQFSLSSGFWTPEIFSPTAATVAVSGRVLTAGGRGIRNAHVIVTFPNGETRSTLCGDSGRFVFGDIEVGETYIFAVTSKRFRFSNPTQVLTITEERGDIYFVADS